MPTVRKQCILILYSLEGIKSGNVRCTTGFRNVQRVSAPVAIHLNPACGKAGDIHKITMKSIFLFLPLLCLAALPSFAQNATKDNSDIRPDIYDPDDEAWEQKYHSSDDNGAKSTYYHTKNNATTDKAKPGNLAGFERVGCICMDGKTRKQTERGACSGHKGVRYWVYQRENGDTLLSPTERHKLHPDEMPDDAPVVFGNAANSTHEHLPPRDAIIYIALLFCAGGGVFFIYRKNKS